MSLSDIKFNYLDRIDNVNARIGRYEEIISDYTRRIKKAEKEENPEVTAVIKSKEMYEHRIEKMLITKEYYQEFVDTADYLMQNLNNYDAVQSNLKHEDLERRNESLHKELERLETDLFLQTNELEKLKISNEINENRIKKQRNQIKELTSDYKLVKVLEKENEFLKKELKKTSKGSANYKELKRQWYAERRKLTTENITLKDTNDFLERKVEQLEDYCNHLLSRREDEPLQMEVKLEGK